MQLPGIKPRKPINDKWVCALMVGVLLLSARAARVHKTYETRENNNQVERVEP